MYGEILFTGIYSALLCIFFLKNPFIRNFYRMDASYKCFMTAFFGLYLYL